LKATVEAFFHAYEAATPDEQAALRQQLQAALAVSTAPGHWTRLFRRSPEKSDCSSSNGAMQRDMPCPPVRRNLSKAQRSIMDSGI
jgi:hypothetical protein